MRKALYGTLIITFCCLCLGLPTNAMADGSHGVKIKVTSNTGREFGLDAFNGNDGKCDFEHKSVRLKKKGQTKKLKCHGKGTGRCKVIGFGKKVLIDGKRTYMGTSGLGSNCSGAVKLKDHTHLVCDWNDGQKRIECISQ